MRIFLLLKFFTKITHQAIDFYCFPFHACLILKRTAGAPLFFRICVYPTINKTGVERVSGLLIELRLSFCPFIHLHVILHLYNQNKSWKYEVLFIYTFICLWKDVNDYCKLRHLGTCFTFVEVGHFDNKTYNTV